MIGCLVSTLVCACFARFVCASDCPVGIVAEGIKKFTLLNVEPSKVSGTVKPRTSYPSNEKDINKKIVTKEDINQEIIDLFAKKENAAKCDSSLVSPSAVDDELTKYQIADVQMPIERKVSADSQVSPKLQTVDLPNGFHISPLGKGFQLTINASEMSLVASIIITACLENLLFNPFVGITIENFTFNFEFSSIFGSFIKGQQSSLKSLKILNCSSADLLLFDLYSFELSNLREFAVSHLNGDQLACILNQLPDTLRVLHISKCVIVPSEYDSFFNSLSGLVTLKRFSFLDNTVGENFNTQFTEKVKVRCCSEPESSLRRLHYGIKVPNKKLP